MSECLLSLGSNLDDRIGNLKTAIGEITSFARIIRVSSIYETEPVGFEDQGWFLNLVLSCNFSSDPLELFYLTREIQMQFSNTKPFKYSPRIIDIDILTFDNLQINSPDLIIPHREMLNRLFVLVPLREIKPDFIHPVNGMGIDTLVKNCMDKSVVLKLGNLFEKDNWMAGKRDGV
jgi:2-amino-4-hydroxy-6-hydroxymethyldihydropteridine diphosphokinase